MIFATLSGINGIFKQTFHSLDQLQSYANKHKCLILKTIIKSGRSKRKKVDEL